MALMGSSIAIAFCSFYDCRSYNWCFAFGVHSLFYITMVIALGSIFVLKMVPNPPHITHTYNKK